MAKFCAYFTHSKWKNMEKKTVAPKERLAEKNNGSQARTLVKLHRRRFKVISRGRLDLISQ